MMQVQVLFFGRLREIVGLAEDRVEMAEGARVEELFQRYGRQFPKLAEFRPSVVASVNQEFAEWNAPLRSGDEVAFLPPVSGGCPEEGTAVAADLCELVRAPIRADKIAARLKAPEDGAVVVFDGVVRNSSAGCRTLHLDYEAYEPMALKKMQEIIEHARAKFPVHRLALVHRLGRLQIGETSVLVVVSSPHRAAAFDACRFVIDTLKRTVPIWKKEYFADPSAALPSIPLGTSGTGGVWVEGELPAVKPSSGSGESTS